ncbi:MAG: hypothetical protein LLG06_09300 [Desulfobacteraceae bacterium]|nr:hypothetical protein [Desulfobacteraceae bacterium]
METTGHLEGKQIIEAVMDETGLEARLRTHLLDCPACRAQVESLASKLARFGQMVVEYAPAPSKMPRILPRKSRTFGLQWRLHPAIGMGLAAASILVLLLIPTTLRHGRTPSMDKIYQEMVLDAKFMTEIRNLEENPLPRFLVDISEPGEADDQDSRLPGGLNERLS